MLVIKFCSRVVIADESTGISQLLGACAWAFPQSLPLCSRFKMVNKSNISEYVNYTYFSDHIPCFKMT